MNKAIGTPVTGGAKPGYWERRKRFMYYKYIDILVRAFAADARSLIDVGSKNTPLIEEFGWIPRRDALDLVTPYQSKNVRGIKADFFTYVPEERYDFALCLQVLEHIPDVIRFARHLFDVAENVLVSVPFMWPEQTTRHHVHDPVSLEKLIAWMGRNPNYDIIVTDPLDKQQRLIAYFHSAQSKFSLKAARGRFEQSLGERQEGAVVGSRDEYNGASSPGQTASPDLSISKARRGGEMNHLSRPIFVVGTPFSGTSILAWALAQHPNVTHVLETSWLAKLASDLESLYELGTARRSDSQLLAMSVSRARFYEPFGAAVDELLLPNRAAPGSPQRWVDGSPEHAAHVAGLLRLFPEARFLHVVRDVPSVAGCLVNWAPPDGSPYTEDSACEHWLRTTKGLLEAEMAFGSERFLRVRYAELLADPERTLRACLAFLDEPYCASCARPVAGLADGSDSPSAGGSYEMQTTSPTRYEAELLSRLLLQESSAAHYSPDPKGIERLDAAFSANARRQPANRPPVKRRDGSLVERVQDVADNVLPPDASVLVISKGDDELLELGGRRAGHFPQNAQGVYAGFHPATSSEAIAHLEDLRAKGRNFLLIPSPYFWWLEHYREFADHLQASYRLVYYHEDTCLIFGLQRPAEGWSPSLRATDGAAAERAKRSYASSASV